MKIPKNSKKNSTFHVFITSYSSMKSFKINWLDLDFVVLNNIKSLQFLNLMFFIFFFHSHNLGFQFEIIDFRKTICLIFQLFLSFISTSLFLKKTKTDSYRANCLSKYSIFILGSAYKSSASEQLNSFLKTVKDCLPADGSLFTFLICSIKEKNHGSLSPQKSSSSERNSSFIAHWR